MREIILSITSDSDKIAVAAIFLLIFIAIVLHTIVVLVRGRSTVSGDDGCDCADTIMVSHYGKDGELIAESETETLFSALAFALVVKNHAIKNGFRCEVRENADEDMVLTVTGEIGGLISKTVFSHEDNRFPDLEQLFKNY